MDEKRAQQRVKFIQRYRSYVINYNLGEDMVRNYIEKRGGTERVPDKRWREFEKLLSSPRLPSGLRYSFVMSTLRLEHSYPFRKLNHTLPIASYVHNSL